MLRGVASLGGLVGEYWGQAVEEGGVHCPTCPRTWDRGSNVDTEIKKNFIRTKF